MTLTIAIAFTIGAFFGATLGILGTRLCAAAREADDGNEIVRLESDSGHIWERGVGWSAP